jgi:hypothetical protein
VVSSENRTVNRSVAFGRSLMKQRNRMGPSDVPWKTDSASRLVESERQPLISTFCVLFESGKITGEPTKCSACDA